MSTWVSATRRLSERFEPNCRVAFHHVPKTGGTSVGAAIRRRFPLSSSSFDQVAAYRMVEFLYPDFDRGVLFSDEFLRFRREYFLNLLTMGRHCIVGHFPFDEIAHERFHPAYHFVTILRDPVKRFISHYFDSHRSEASSDHPFAITASMEELLEMERGRRFGRIYSEFYSGLHERVDYSSPDIVRRAKRNLERFSVVGFLEDTDVFIDRLRQRCGLRIRLPHLRQGRVSQKRKMDILTPAMMDRIRETCAVDIEIYEWARNRFV